MMSDYCQTDVQAVRHFLLPLTSMHCGTSLVPRAFSSFKMAVGERHFERGEGPGEEVAVGLFKSQGALGCGLFPSHRHHG